MEKILNQLDFFVDFLKKTNQHEIANLIEKNKDEIATFFYNKNENLNDFYIRFRAWQKSIWLFFRKNKKEPWQKLFLAIKQIEKLNENKIIETQKNINKRLKEIEKTNDWDNDRLITNAILIKQHLQTIKELKTNNNLQFLNDYKK